MSDVICFQLAHEGKKLRFVLTREDGDLFAALKERVQKMAKSSDVTIQYKKDESKTAITSTADIDVALSTLNKDKKETDDDVPCLEIFAAVRIEEVPAVKKRGFPAPPRPWIQEGFENGLEKDEDEDDQVVFHRSDSEDSEDEYLNISDEEDDDSMDFEKIEKEDVEENSAV
ncbi:hypothetical protein PFISCL1PPCAC_1154 [Pristionchus fissidentatus]|uniref:PB1 domain-containing protein n=1 Tax=Pristionchus fissidentatus TaxID=1538716 RepID=A0AAV5UTE0_9BILA|nr:hypothetical protein PFISCL1PPCAC_1154 [Pristionchus fissidentatus]